MPRPRKVVFMYPGQGAQYFRMGAELYRSEPRFRKYMRLCDGIASPYLHESLLQALYEREYTPSDIFPSLAISNAALLSTEYSLARLLMDTGLRPDLHLGYSLGEFAAAVIADSITLEAALWFVIEFAKVVADTVPSGGMLSILESVSLMDRHTSAFAGCTLSGVNFHRNFVVSGGEAALEGLRFFLQGKEVVCYTLPVKYGFHSPWVDPAEAGFKELAHQIQFRKASQPMVSPVMGRGATLGSEYLWNVLRRPVQFEQAVRGLIAEGDFFFVDAGPSGSLATYVKYILPPGSSSRQASTINRFGRDMNSIRMLGLDASEMELAKLRHHAD